MALTTGGRFDGESETFVPFTLHGSDDCARVASEAEVAQSLRCRAPGTIENSSTNVVAHTLKGEGHDASEDGTGRGVPLVCGTLSNNGKAAGSATQQDAESGLLVNDRLIVTVLDLQTGRTASDDRWDWFWWTQGNGSCDCNRKRLFGENDVDSGYCIGCKRYVVVLVNGQESGPEWNEGYPKSEPLVFDATNITSKANRTIVEAGRECHTLNADSLPPTIAFQSKQSSTSQAPSFDDVAPTLDVSKAGGTAVAFQCHGGDVGNMGVLRSGHGDVQSGVPFMVEQNTQCSHPELPSLRACETPNTGAVTHAGVRRLTPAECERLQGLPEIDLSCIIEVCLDHQKSSASVENQSPKSQRRAGSVARNGDQESAPSAASDSLTSDQREKNVAPIVARIVCEGSVVEIRKADGSIMCASIAGGNRNDRHLVLHEDFAQAIVGICTTADQLTRHGKAELRLSERCSIRVRNGVRFVALSLDEKTAFARDVPSNGKEERERLRDITGSHSRSNVSDFDLTTLCSYVVRATNGFIPDATQRKSFAIEVVFKHGWTELDDEGNVISDSARYRMIGNAVCRTVVEWVGKQLVKMKPRKPKRAKVQRKAKVS